MDSRLPSACAAALCRILRILRSLAAMGSGGSVPEKVVAAEKKAASPAVAIIYYSTYGHVKKMADEIKSGGSTCITQRVASCEGSLCFL